MFCQRRRKDMQCNVNHRTLRPSTNNINSEIVDCRVPARSNALTGSSSCDYMSKGYNQEAIPSLSEIEGTFELFRTLLLLGYHTELAILSH